VDRLFDLGPIKVVDFADAYSPSHISNAVIHCDSYGIRKIDFKPNDVVIDIGANIGIFSIYLAILHPEITIYSFEPSIVNYEHFLVNIAQNKVTNVQPFNLALTDNSRDIWISVNEDNSGGACMYAPISGHCNISKSTTLDNFITEKNIDKVKFLKCDCEGAEYEILKTFKQWGKIEYLSCEIHPNKKDGKRYPKNDLEELIKSKLDTKKVIIDTSEVSGLI